MKVVRVQHVSVNCDGQLEETRSFYADLFETTELQRPVIPGIGGSWLALGDAQLHLVDAPPIGTPIDRAGDHWCVEVTDLDAARAELEHRGIPYDEGAQGPVVQLWINDPCGRTIELQQAR
jgi:catechol 2,3-dioxygenase-like lactoylglutathione lyase family enzyme